MMADKDELAELTARVAQLERQVTALNSATMSNPWPKRTGVVQRTTAAAPPMPEVQGLGTQLPVALPAQAPTRSLESRLGSQVFNMIGIVAIIVGTSWFLKLAIERGWVGPTARVVIGLVAGAGLVLWSERFRRKGFAAFSYSLKALGSGILYLSLWASFRLYGLIPASVALLAMVLVTAWNGFMAWSQDAELLVAYGLIGGFATPLLLSTGGNHETFLFSYIAVLDIATVVLIRRKPWQRLLLPAFAGTVAYFIGWYMEFFHSGGVVNWNGDSSETALFALVFFAIFAVVSMKGFSTIAADGSEVIVPVLIPLTNAAFVAGALYSVMQDSGQHGSLAWLMVGLAVLYLGFTRVQATMAAGALHLASAVVFLTASIPLKASGHALTKAWLIEGLVLYWAATRVGEGSVEESEGTLPAARKGAQPGILLGWLALGAYALGLMSLAEHWILRTADAGFFSADMGSAFVAVAALAGAAWLATRPVRNDKVTLLASLIAIDFVGLLLTLREVAASSFYLGVHPAFANAEFWTSVIGLIVLAGTAWTAYLLTERTLAGATLVLFNLLTILSIEREIGALWHRDTANLQRSLAISGFLMAYGALLLAAGFWRRSAFVRWQALVLLLFTIGKVFTYDSSGLSQVYRVASFMALGAVLMTISFAYQKDWLGLKVADDEPSRGEP